MSEIERSNSFTWRGFSGEAANSLLPFLDAWMDFLAASGEAPAGGALVKSNLYRGVWRIENGPSKAREAGQAFYFKRYRFPRLKDCIKYAFFETRAEVEWKVARGLAERGLKTLVPLLYAERRRFGVPVEAFFLSREIVGAEPLDKFLAKLAPAVRPTLFDRLAAYVASMHAKSVHHRDLHQSNLLALDLRDPKIALVDLHTVHLGVKIGKQRRVRNLAQLLHSLTPAMLPAEKDAFLEHYRQYAPGIFSDAKALATAIERRIWKIVKIQARSRDRRCLVRSSVYEVRRRPFVRVYRRREYPESWIAEAIEQHRRAPQARGSAVLKREGRSLVTRVPAGENGAKLPMTPLCVKEIGPGGLGSIFEEAARGTRGRRAWAASHALARRGIASPAAYALRENFFFGLPLRSYLVTEFLEGTESLLDFFRGGYGRLLLGERERFLETLAAFVAKVHREGLYHRDFQLRNVLVRRAPSGDWQLYLIDLESVRVRTRLTRLRRLRNLMQLNDCPSSVSRADRLRFLRAYESAFGKEASEEDLRWISENTRARLDRAAKRSKAKN